MNKVRIIGLVLLIVGIIIQFTMENDMTDFISAARIGAGCGLLVTGKVVKPSF
jgi:type III secretory pathway component EscU